VTLVRITSDGKRGGMTMNRQEVLLEMHSAVDNLDRAKVAMGDKGVPVAVSANIFVGKVQVR
jgi:hypothetical protein